MSRRGQAPGILWVTRDDSSPHLYLVASAPVTVNGVAAQGRDGIAITGEDRVTIHAEADAELVLVNAR